MSTLTAEEIARLVIEALQSQQASSLSVQESAKPNPTQVHPDAEQVITFNDSQGVGVQSPRNRTVIDRAQSITPARIGVGRTGTRMRTASYLKFRIDHAAAQDAVMKDVREEFLRELGLPILETVASDMETYLMNLYAGRTLSAASVAWLEQHAEKGNQVQILVCDGLSSSAVEANIKDLLPSLLQSLKLKHIRVGQPLFVKRSRVWVQDHVASLIECDLVISLIGERPGLATDESLSAYMVYRPNQSTVEADRTVISNIHKGGLSSVEAGAYLGDLLSDMLQWQCSGVQYAQKRHR